MRFWRTCAIDGPRPGPGKVGFEIGERPPHVARVEREQLGGGRGEAPDARVSSQYDDRNGHAGEDVGQIFVQARRVSIAHLHLVVHRTELFVGGLQLLLGHLQLFVGAAQLLVAGDDLFVGGPQLLVAGLELFDDRLKIVAGRGQLLGQLVVVLARRLDGGGRSPWRLGGHQARLAEQDHEEPLGRRGHAKRDHLQPELARPSARPRHRPARDGLLRPGLVDGLPERQPQLLADHSQQIEAGHPGRRLQEGAGAASELHDGQVVGHHHARRRELGQHQPVDLPVDVLGHRGLGPRQPLGGPQGRQTTLTEFQERPRRCRRARVNTILGIDRDEAREGSDRLGVPQDQKPGLPQRVVEDRQEPILERGAEIDHQVAAADEVHAGEWRIAGGVLFGEHAQVPDVLADLIEAVVVGEEPLQPPGGDVAFDAGGVPAGARLVDGRGADVGAEQLDRQITGVGIAQELEERDGDRVDLLAGRAAGDPDAQRRVAGPILEELGEDRRAEGLEGLRIAKEAGDVDQDLVAQRAGLLGVVLDQLGVGRQAGDAIDDHPPLDPPAKRGLLVAREVDGARLAQGGQDAAEGLLIGGGR